MDFRERMKAEMLRRKLSNRTIKTYLQCVDSFLKSCRKDMGKISKADAREYLNSLAAKGRPGNTLNVHLNAIKFLLEEVMGKRMKLNIKYSKKPETLPVVLLKEEVKRLFDAVENQKHRLMIELLYSAGLRVSELLNIRVGDLELDKGYGFVRGGKGNKDRLFILSEKLVGKIRKLIEEENLAGQSHLFISNRNDRYGPRSVQEIIKNAARKAGIKKKIHPHTLRHSFATHLIENGYSVSEVQSLLGHKSPETTMVYVHTASDKMIKVKSPIDEI